MSICIGSRFPIAIYWGPELALLYNEAWSPILGEKHPWALGRPAHEVWPEIWDTIGPMFQEVTTTGEATYSEDSLLLMHRHGYTEECYFNFTFSPIRGEGGRVEGIFNAVIETTYRVLAERRTRLLRDLGTRLVLASTTEEAGRLSVESLAGSADVPFCLIYLVEAGHGRLAGAAGVAAGSIVAPETIELGNESASLWPLARAYHSQRIEVLADLDVRFGSALPGNRGAGLASSAFMVPVVLSTGERPIALLVMGANPRRAVDSEYLDFVEKAGSQIAASFASTKRREELAELDRAKIAFFSNVSHEFRTPLTLMLGPTEDALRASSPRLEGEDLRMLHRNELRLLKLVNALLDFARIEAGRTQANRIETDLSPLTRELANAFEQAIRSAGLEFKIDCPPLDRAAFVDHEMWEKIVLNLLSNALKFTFEGSITVSLRPVGDEAVLSVTDTGTGIPDSELPRMFDRFHRVVGARARTHEGSGIGLALVHELVKMNGGRIEVESALGHGSTFRVYLPLERVPAARVSASPATDVAKGAPTVAPFVQEAMRWLKESPSPASSPLARTSAQPNAERVLVADDNNDMREYVARLLSEHFAVETVRNGEEALAAIRRRRPDLVVSDVMMPGLDGFGLLRALREGEHAFRDLPVILLSARAGEEATFEGIAAGADDYLVKPFSARELLIRVTARLNSSRARVRERQRLLTLLEQIPANVNFLSGPEFVFEFAHPLAVKALGGRALLGRKLLEAMPEHEGQPFYERLKYVYATGEPFSQREAQARLVVGGREIVTYWTSEYLPLRDDSGRIEGVMTFDIDVTAQVEATQRLEEASRAKDDFLAMLGHELRNPLAPISTAVHLLKLRANEEVRREVSVIERQSRHIGRLVDDLLDVSRIARGKVLLSRDSVEVSALVAGAIELASPMIEQGHHTLVVKVPQQGLVVDVDRARMIQVFANLLTNAAKYTPTGGRITITAVREAAEIVTSFEDSGTGISSELLPRVFDLFVQSRQTLDRSQGGLGLGLAIVKNLVAMHGGSVSAQSEGHGCGSTFTVRLPDNLLSAASSEPEASPEHAENEPHGRRVLVVDDNLDGAEMLAEILEMFGYDTAMAHDGPEALRVAAEFLPQIALLDIGLPVMDGYELATRLRERWPELKLVAITGYGQESDRERARRTGFSAHLTKPVNVEVLAKLIEDLTRDQQARPPTP